MLRVIAGPILLFAHVGCLDAAPTPPQELPPNTQDLSPRTWPSGELARYWAIASNSTPYKEAIGATAMVTGTTAPVAIRAGIEAIDRGGTAADAVTTTALAQIVIAAGCWVSFAGRITAVYYDAGTGQVYALNANYNVPLAETDPLSIPSVAPSGRSALVPGFMAGIEALQRRFGTLDWSSIFTPAIWLAEEGFVLSNNMANLIANRADVLTRLPETRAVFTTESGRLYRAGDLFRQPALARTLRHVAVDGARYMYEGAWAEKLVQSLAAEGGRMTIEDLRRYEVEWHTPSHARFRGYDIYGLQPPNNGGPMMTETFRILEASPVAQQPRSYVTDAPTLYALLQASFVPLILRSSGALQKLQAALPGLDVGPDRISAEDAQRIWDFIESDDWASFRADIGVSAPAPSEHSDAVVAVDPMGNVAAIIHTINTGAWGTTGIFVDGVSIPNSAANQQSALVVAGPGGRVSDYGPPTMVLEDGKPVLASSATGGGNVWTNWQNVYNVLALDITPKDAVDQPNFYSVVDFVGGEFPDATLDGLRELGQNVNVVSAQQVPRGFWTGIKLTDGLLAGGVVRWLDGIAIGR